MRYTNLMFLLVVLFAVSLSAQVVDGVNANETAVTSGAANDIVCHSGATTVGPCDTGDFFWNAGLLTLDQAAHGIAFGTDPADAGVIRLSNATAIQWEADPAGTDLSFSVNASEQFAFNNGNDLVTIGGGTDTLFVEDTEVTTGKTLLVIQEGDGQVTTETLLEFRNDSGTPMTGFKDRGRRFEVVGSGNQFILRLSGGGGSVAGFVIDSVSDFTRTTTNQNHILVNSDYKPTSGTGTFHTFRLTPEINQTGGASGIVRVIYVEPAVIAAADFRAIEVADVGATHFALKTGTGEVSFGDKVSAVPGGNIPVCPKYTVAAAALTTASATEDEVLFNLPANGVLMGVRVKHSLAFSGGSSSAMTVSIGDSSSTTLYTVAFNVFQAAGAEVMQFTDMFKAKTSLARDLLARFTVTDDTMDNVTAGSVDIHVCWVVLP